MEGRQGEIIVVGTFTGKWVVLDVNTREVFGVHQDGSEPVHVVSFSPDSGFLALGSRDNAIYIYQVSRELLTPFKFCTYFYVFLL